MTNMWIIFKRELRAYFVTPVAYVFIVIFLLLTGMMTFYVGGFYERNQADLETFFRFHPWLYLFLIPGHLDAPVVGGSARAEPLNC